MTTFISLPGLYSLIGLVVTDLALWWNFLSDLSWKVEEIDRL